MCDLLSQTVQLLATTLYHVMKYLSIGNSQFVYLFHKFIQKACKCAKNATNLCKPLDKIKKMWYNLYDG